MPVRTDADGRDHGNHARTADRVDHRAVDVPGFADKAQVDDAFDIAVGVAGGALDLFGADEVAVLARYADGLAARLCDPADQFLVDRTRQDHFGDLRGFRIGHAQAIDERRFDAEFLEHRADLRPAPVDHNRIDADGLEQDDVLGKILRGLRRTHRVPAIFDDENLPRIALHIRQRLDEHFGLGEQ